MVDMQYSPNKRNTYINKLQLKWQCQPNNTGNKTDLKSMFTTNLRNCKQTNVTVVSRVRHFLFNFTFIKQTLMTLCGLHTTLHQTVWLKC